MKVYEFEAYLKSLGGGLNPEEGILWGDLVAEVKTVHVSWMPTLDASISLIETGHEVSETPGIRRFLERLETDLPDIRFVLYDNPRPWATL